ncbi:MAG: L-threonylcarbamoyladenylate synthase, partial [Cyanobacteria bacterium P01_F01_bin.153]
MDQVSLTRLIEIARGGGLVSFPTDTVPALAIKPENSAEIFRAKGRSPTKPLILMAADLDSLLPYVKGSEGDHQRWKETAEKYWPGALTLVMPSSDRVPVDVHRLSPATVGMRIPNHPIAKEVLRATGVLATTSANLSGKPPLRLLRRIAHTFPEVAALETEAIAPYVDSLGDSTEMGSGQPSTVAQWTNQGWSIFRQGSVTLDDSFPT